MEQDRDSNRTGQEQECNTDMDRNNTGQVWDRNETGDGNRQRNGTRRGQRLNRTETARDRTRTGIGQVCQQVP